MKFLLSYLFIVGFSVSLFAQADLFVRPNPSTSTDSYVYVNDEILYVTDDINLQVNTNNAATQASIYLRNQAQLIQGTSGAVNSGNGMLSVYQNAPDSDQWTYNYWCSPISHQGQAGSGNTNFGTYRLYDIVSTTSSTQSVHTWNANGTSSPFQISAKWIYTKPRGLEALNDYVFIGPYANVPAGMGFTMKGVDPTPVAGTGFEYDFRGRPNNGDFTINVYDGEYTLSGNPYPSALDLNRLFWDSDNNELVQFRYWDEDKTRNSHTYEGNAGGYGTYVPGSSDPNGIPDPPSAGYQAGIYTPPVFRIWASDGSSSGSLGGGANYERRFAPIGQGVLFEPDATGDGVVHVKNSHRRYMTEGVANDSQFRGPLGSNTNGNPDPSADRPDYRMPQVRLNAYFKNSHVRQMVLAFSDESTDNFDRGLDGMSPIDAENGDAYFPTLKDEEKVNLVIQTIPFDNPRKKVPISFKVDEQTTVSIQFVELVNVPFLKAYLYDNTNESYQEIKMAVQGGSYDEGASVLLDPGMYEDRFYIAFRSAIQQDDEIVETTLRTNENVDFFQNNPEGLLEVRNPEEYDIKRAQIFDMTGKLVYTQDNVGTQREFTIPTSTFSDGVYLIHLLTSENIVIDYKTTIFNK